MVLKVPHLFCLRRISLYYSHLWYPRRGIIFLKFRRFYHEITAQALAHAKHVRLGRFIAHSDRFFNAEGMVQGIFESDQISLRYFVDIMF